MSRLHKTTKASPAHIAERIQAIDWEHIAQNLDAHGSAMVAHLLSQVECETVTALYSQNDLFRSRILMERHGFGRGEYQYFKYPLPELIGKLRTVIYPY